MTPHPALIHVFTPEAPSTHVSFILLCAHLCLLVSASSHLHVDVTASKLASVSTTLTMTICKVTLLLTDCCILVHAWLSRPSIELRRLTMIWGKWCIAEA